TSYQAAPAGLLEALAVVWDRDLAEPQAARVGDAVDDALHARPSPATSARRPNARDATGPVSAPPARAIGLSQPRVPIAPTKKSGGNPAPVPAPANPPAPRHGRGMSGSVT